MSADTAIIVENLSKSYRIGHERASRGGYQTLRESMMRGFSTFSHKTADMLRGRQVVEGDEIEEIWALRGVSFEVKRGEMLGIIGRNGAGKSTLLKILSRITEPSEGRVTIKGRVASLLEVGTGFHPELTGRENIHLNGAILGMTRAEIRRKFDEIVAFAEVEKFLDTAVKRYSSGMYVRLAFAVAAHLDPEILIIDEVLAVGDADFQRKCLGKMGQISKSGRTVLFVTHNMPLVLNLCENSIMLKAGRIAVVGRTNDVVKVYLSDPKTMRSVCEVALDDPGQQKSLPYFTVERLSIVGYDTTCIVEASDNAQLHIEIRGIFHTVDRSFNLGLVVINEFGETVIMTFSTDQPEHTWLPKQTGSTRVRTTIDTSILNQGRYSIYLVSSVHCVTMLHNQQDNIFVSFEIVGNRGRSPYWTDRRRSILAPFIHWTETHDV